MTLIAASHAGSLNNYTRWDSSPHRGQERWKDSITTAAAIQFKMYNI